MTSLQTPHRRPGLLLRLASIPIVAGLLVLGVWIAGGVITNDFHASVALTTAWFALAGAACLAVAVRWRAFRVPVLAAYVVTAGAIGGLLGLSMLDERVADERVVTGTPAGELPPRPSRGGDEARPRPANVEVARGRFRSGEHATRGTAAVVRTAGGRRVLTFTRFDTSPGPDLRVRLVRGERSVDLGALKGTRGDQQYRIPAGAKVAGATAVVWCRAFSVAFGSAALRAS
jgi:Electron transfer DM13